MIGPSIDIVLGDESNGADIPPAWCVFFAVTLFSCLFLGLRDAAMIGLFIAAIIAWLLPKVHAEYIGAVFVHDIGLKKFRHIFSRRRIDKMFLKAMRLERWPLTVCPKLNKPRDLLKWGFEAVPLWAWRCVRPYLIFGCASAWGILKERRNYFHKHPTSISIQQSQR